jgi:hypothetical protein
MKTNLLNTNSKFKTSEIVGILIACSISVILMKVLNYNKISLFEAKNSNNSLFGLSTFFGCVVFFLLIILWYLILKVFLRNILKNIQI